jgi:FkbM family methyltransferase
VDCNVVELALNARTSLEELLEESIGSATRRADVAFDEAAQPYESSIVLFGAGGLGRRTLARLRGIGIEPRAFVDNDRALHGTVVDGLLVLAPTEAARRYHDSAVFVVTIWGAGSKHRFEHTQGQLLILGCRRVVSFAMLYWKFPQVFLPYYMRDRPEKLISRAHEVRCAVDVWHDEASRQEYVSQVRWRLDPEFTGLAAPVRHSQYFPPEVRVRADECFIDCGAYDGDTLRVFLSRTEKFRRFVAIEPDPLNFSRLRDYVASLPGGLRSKIGLAGVAVGARDEIIPLDATGTEASRVGMGEATVQSVRLDVYLSGEPPVTWLKLDVEGAEGAALEGAKQLIRRNRPIIAVAVYHRPDHLWAIPLLLKTWCEEYQFLLRPHHEEGWDLVCYAIPRERWVQTESPVRCTPQ